MRLCIIGAGSMGSLCGGLLARAGFDVTLPDVWKEHIEASRCNGLHRDGITGDLRIPIRATTEVGDGTRAAGPRLSSIGWWSPPAPRPTSRSASSTTTKP
jgi:hypothetical protein